MVSWTDEERDLIVSRSNEWNLMLGIESSSVHQFKGQAHSHKSDFIRKRLC
jgi:hypothetical protein